MKELLRFAPWKNTDTLVSLGSGSGWWEINCVVHQPAVQLILVDHDLQVLTNEEVGDSISYFENTSNKKTLKQAWRFSFLIYLFVGRAGFEPAKFSQQIYSLPSLAA